MKLVFSLLLLATLLSSSIPVSVGSFSYEENVMRGVDFLISQYNPGLRLCREAPKVAPNTYWLLSDNLLAQYALKDYYPNVSSAIMDELKRRGYAEDGHYDALIGKPIPVPNKKMMTLIIEETENYTIKADVRNEAEYFIDWAQYADRLLLHALSLVWKGDTEQANKYFNYAKKLWDGKGLKDPPQAWSTQAGLYETYKLPMLLLVSKVLNEPLPFRQELEQVLWSLQREDGGIITHYNMTTLEPVGDANTETTAITVIAYTYKKGEGLNVTLIIGVMVLITIAIGLVIYIRVKKKKRLP
jgi:hypothetical protein